MLSTPGITIGGYSLLKKYGAEKSWNQRAKELQALQQIPSPRSVGQPQLKFQVLAPWSPQQPQLKNQVLQRAVKRR